MKCFWIGERTEIFIGKSVQDICDHYKLKCKSESMREEYELMQEAINNNIFGEIKSVELVIEFDDGEKRTVKDFLRFSDGVSQISSAYC